MWLHENYFKEWRNSLGCSMIAQEEENTTFNYKSLRKERTLKRMLKEHWTYWLEMLYYHLEFWICTLLLRSDFFHWNLWMFLNWWFTKHSFGFNFSLSPRRLIHKLFTEVDYMPSPNIFQKVKKQSCNKKEIVV